MNPFFASARELAALYRLGETTPLAVTEALLERIAALEPEALSLALRRCTVMVYATGTRDALALVPPNVDAFEFRYEPEVGSIGRLLLPTLDSVRQVSAAKE